MLKWVILYIICLSEFIICARTDARGVYGMEEAIKRATKVKSLKDFF